MDIPEIRDCPDCGVKPGQPHEAGCDVEICSACGGQRLQCYCPNHDRAFSRWTGYFPLHLEYLALQVKGSDLYMNPKYASLVIKPRIPTDVVNQQRASQAAESILADFSANSEHGRHMMDIEDDEYEGYIDSWSDKIALAFEG